MLLAALAVVFVCMAIAMARGFLGPSAYDRILAVNLFGTKTSAAILLIAFLADDMMYLDIALVYALVNFIATIALLKYFTEGSFTS